MQKNHCRVCGKMFYEKPLLRYNNMPKSAQNLPEFEGLENDVGVNIEVCQCSGCGLVQLSNDPVPYYKEVIRAAAFSDEMKSFRREQFASFVQKYSLNNKKIIEIGCGRGEYLTLLREYNVKAFGVEYSEEAVIECCHNGLIVSRDFIERDDQSLKYAPFDAFFILNFLEHLPDPNSTLTGVYNHLSDDGVGLVEVPNFEMNLRNNLFSEFVCDHLLYFTRETLNTTLRLNGFEVIECNEVWHENMISAVVKKRNKLDISHFHSYELNLKYEIEQYILGFKDKNEKVAIWGAGHSALAIIALMNLGDKIEYVVDSAVFKQGKYTPVTHVRIVSPDILEIEPVDAIIVMTGGYSNEVAEMILKKYNRNINISILRNSGLEAV